MSDIKTDGGAADNRVVIKVVLVMTMVFGSLGAGYLWLNGAFGPCGSECIYNMGTP